MKDYFIKIDPYLVERLQVVDLPFDCIDDFTGRKSQSVVVFCDCGGDKKDFEIFGYYVTDFQYGDILIKKLRSIKERHGIPERTIDYKGRKDRKKRIAFPDWINEVKKFPGIIYLVAFDRRIESDNKYKRELRKFGEDIFKLKLHDDIWVAQRMIRTLAFISILAPKFKEHHKLLWVSDDDCIFANEIRHEAFKKTLVNTIQEVAGHGLQTIGYATPFGDKESFKEFEELLSISDMAAGAYSASLTYDIENIKGVDEETNNIITEFSCIADISEYRKEITMKEDKPYRVLYPIMGMSIMERSYNENNSAYLKHRILNMKRLLRNIDEYSWRQWLINHCITSKSVGITFDKNSKYLILNDLTRVAKEFGWEFASKKESYDKEIIYEFKPILSRNSVNYK